MEQNVSQNDNRQPCFRKVIGNTTYVVRVHFCKTSSETLEDKIKRLVRDEGTNQQKDIYLDKLCSIDCNENPMRQIGIC